MFELLSIIFAAFLLPLLVHLIFLAWTQEIKPARYRSLHNNLWIPPFWYTSWNQPLKHFSIPSLICYGCLKPSCYNSVGCLAPVFSLAIVRDASVSLFLRGQKWPSGPDATALHVKKDEISKSQCVCVYAHVCICFCDIRTAHAWSRIVVSRSSYRLHWSVQRRARHYYSNV